MAGVSSPAMAAAVSNAGALGSTGIGATDATGARAMIDELRSRTSRSFDVNVFCHRPAVRDDAGKALHAVAKAKGVFGYGAPWAGQGAPLARSMPSTRMVETLVVEMAAAS